MDPDAGDTQANVGATFPAVMVRGAEVTVRLLESVIVTTKVRDPFQPVVSKVKKPFSRSELLVKQPVEGLWSAL